MPCHLQKVGPVSVCSQVGRQYIVKTIKDQAQNLGGLQSWQGLLMSFHPPVQLFESAQLERPLSRTAYCHLHHVDEVCATALNDLLCRVLYWNQIRLGLFVDLKRYYGQALQQAEWAGFHKTSSHGNHVGGHTGYHSRGPNNLQVNERQQNLGRGLCTSKTGLSSLPSPVIYYWPFCCGLFLWLVFVRLMFVLDFLFVWFRIAWWSSAGKELSSWLSACAVLLYAVLSLCISFLFDARDRMWNSIV